jgi:HK97 family phage major capsid protein
MSNALIEQLLKDINARMDAMHQAVDENRLRLLVETHLNELLANPDSETVRKFRFANPQADRKLIGTKYARWGLSLADIEWLYDIQLSRAARQLGDGPSDELRNTFNAISAAYYIPEEEVRRIDRRAIDNLFPRIPLAAFSPKDRLKAARGAYELTDAYQAAVRAMDTAESGYGSQLIGAQYVGELWEAARRESRIFGLIETFEMTDPTAYLPVEVDFPEMLFVSESSASNSSNYTTSKTGSQRVQVDAKKFVVHQMWSGEMEEDAIVPFVPFLRRQAMLGIAHYADSVVLNGDTTNAGTGNINLDDADPADTKHYLAFDGIRHAGLVDNTGNSADLAGAITLAALNSARGRMVDTTRYVDWGHPQNREELVYIADVETGDKIALLDEVVTADKTGNPNTAGALNGEVGRILGHPVIVSMAMSKTEADGKVSTTGSNNVKGQVVTFNRRGFKTGWRRRVKAEVERLPGSDQTRIVYSLRLGFGRFTPTGAASGIEAADVIYDISL